MKKNAIAVSIIIFILISLIVYLYHTNKQLVIEYNNIINENQVKIKNQEQINRFEIDSENIELSNNIKLEDETGQMVYLHDICPVSKLICRYSEINCNVCIDAQIENIKQILSTWKNEDIIFIATYQQTRDLFVFKRVHGLKIKIYNLKGNLNLPVERQNTPYYFIYNGRNNRATNVFIPVKENPEPTIYYLNSLFNKYFEKEDHLHIDSTNKK